MTDLLQWGRALVSAEGGTIAPRGRKPERASMGPRSGERGRNLIPWVLAFVVLASMGPRSGERGRIKVPAQVLRGSIASMGPRSGERGRSASRRAARPAAPRFNGAALW